MSDFTGKRFVITGAGTGIGARITRRTIGKGASVIGIYNTAADEARKLEQEFPNAVKMLHADLADPESIGGLADSLLGEGELDGLVNNAGAIDFRNGTSSLSTSGGKCSPSTSMRRYSLSTRFVILLPVAQA